MRLLLDTHILLWSMDADAKLTPDLRDAIEAADEVFVSAVSIWEIAIKTALGKLAVAGDIESRALEAGCQPLPVTWAHGRDVGRLPLHHHDPFDRLLVAQAQVENIPLITHDRQLERYDVRIIRA